MLDVGYWHLADIRGPAHPMSAFGGKADIANQSLMSAFDPKRTSAAISCCSSEDRFRPYSKYSFEPVRCCLLSLGADMRRREFLGVLGGAAARGRSRRARSSRAHAAHRSSHGSRTADDPESQARSAAFVGACSNWAGSTAATCGSTIAGPGAMPSSMRKHAAELVALAPDVILAGGSATVAPLQQATRTVPIVFTIVPDPVGAGFVESLARPGGNITGFMQVEYNLSGKWLELLKQIAPGVTRAAVLRDAAITAGIGQFAVIQSVAPSVGRGCELRSACATPARSSAPSRPLRAPPMAA